MPASSLLLPLLPLAAALPVFAGQDGQQQAAQTDVIAIRKDQWSRMTVPVKVVEKGPFRFLIDTGSQNTALSTDLAARLSLVPNRKARLISVAGIQMVDMVEIDQIELGRRSYYGLTAPLLQSEHMGADGILGLDSLQDQRVLVDFKKGLMAIDDAKNLGGNRGFEIVVEARRRSGQLIMADARLEGIKVQVVIDTGAETSIGNIALQKALSRKRKSEKIELLSVTGHSVSADLSYAPLAGNQRSAVQQCRHRLYRCPGLQGAEAG
jgi:predicted aspartyl protease